MADIAKTTVLLLAAGLSRRYGAADKLVATYRGKPLALHAAEMLAALPCARHLAVCRSDDHDLAARLTRLGFELVRNPDSARGLASSLALGVAAAGSPDALLVCLADMPLVTSGHLLDIVARVTPGGIVASTAAPLAPPTPPAAFAREILPELLRLEGDTGARHLLQRAERVIAPAGTLVDFDTPDDFEA